MFRLNNKIFIILIILALVCSMVIIKCYFLQNIDLITTIVFIPREFRELYLDMSIGYIVSFVFYILQVYFPEKLKSKKFYKKNYTNLENLFNDLKKMIVCIDNFYYIEVDKPLKIRDTNRSIILKLVEKIKIIVIGVQNFFIMI